MTRNVEVGCLCTDMRKSIPMHTCTYLCLFELAPRPSLVERAAMAPKAKAKPKAKTRAQSRMIPRPLPYLIRFLEIDRAKREIANEGYTAFETSAAVDFLIECNTTDLEYGLRTPTTFRPRLMPLIAPRYAANRAWEERMVNVRKRRNLKLVAQPYGMIWLIPK